MKAIATIIGISAIVGLAVIGPFTMAHGADHSGDCPIATLSGSSCLALSSVFGHLETVSHVLSGVVPQSVITAMVFGMLLVAIGIATSPIRPGLHAMTLVRDRREHLSQVSASRRAFLFWTSRLEHSPTIS